VVPADSALDPKALAKLAGDRKCDTVSLKEVTPLTGVRGTQILVGPGDYARATNAKLGALAKRP
jgi:prolyl-tRNA editing enzyme YbaK/EbsC (Cys-tRNA(Pro) deacylase)